MNFTTSQLQAIEAKGDTLVIAGAGTGKTRTLVERCVRWLLDPKTGIELDEMLVVTFTEAAAAEIRHRIRLRLETELERHPDHGRLLGQLAALETAHISTLHSFCLELVRQHFHELEIDPQLSVLADEQSALLAEETLDQLLERHYAAATPESEAVQRFLRDYARSWETRVRGLIRELHHFTQTRPDPEGWFETQQRMFDETDPSHWRQWFRNEVEPWRSSWMPVLAQQPEENTHAQQCLQALESAGERMDAASWIEFARSMQSVLQSILACDQDWPARKKKHYREPIKKLFEEAAFLLSLLPSDTHADPLKEDWDWIRTEMTTLLRLAREFARDFAAAKRERGAVDFHDLEQFTLQLLWDPSKRQPSPLAREWQARLKWVFVDEYQDINEAQDTILTALSRTDEWGQTNEGRDKRADESGPALRSLGEGGGQANEGRDKRAGRMKVGNRFLVGDVKQSIYRFRQAAPHIFQEYSNRWGKSQGSGQTVLLSDNFRSREALLQFLNPLFGAIMQEEIGGVNYTEDVALQFGNREERRALAVDADSESCVEMLMRVKGAGDSQSAVIESELTDAESEARMVAQRLMELFEARHPVWDTEQQSTRPVRWSDMVVLLRSPQSKVDSFAKEFARLNIPLQAKRAGFFDSIEVQDLVNLLRLLDNPLQDVAAVAVLRSPLAGLTLDELTLIRLASPRIPFWTALKRWHAARADGDGKASTAFEAHDDGARSEVLTGMQEAAAPVLFQKVDLFLKRFGHWRAQSRQASLAQRLEMVLAETAYGDWLITQPRGEQRQANVAQLLTLAREFDELYAQGLHRFLLLIEAQQEAAGDREPAPLESGDAVRLMSIHQSKGLEFPVVVVADLGKRFNLADSRHGVVLDEQYGLCAQVRPPDTGQFYPSLPLWLARRRQRAEALGEEMRILYVAMTRAQDALILTGTASAISVRERWPDQCSETPTPRQLLQAQCYLDWIVPWMMHMTQSGDWLGETEGRHACFRWRIDQHESISGEDESGATLAASPRPDSTFSNVSLVDLEKRLTWRYPFADATIAPAKASVTGLRHLLENQDEESSPAGFLQAGRFEPRKTKAHQLSAGQRGLAHHRFLQWVDLTRTDSMENLTLELERLERAGLMSQPERQAVDLESVSQFWQSDIGSQIRGQRESVRREWPFTCRLTAEDFPGRSGENVAVIPDHEFMVVQGVADLVVMREEEIWLLDFKTDHFPERDLPQKIEQYRPQLQLYSLALERIYRKKVSHAWLHFLSLNRTEKVGLKD